MALENQEVRPEWELARERVLKIHPDAAVYCAVTTNGSYAIGSAAVGKTISAQKWDMEDCWLDAERNLVTESAAVDVAKEE